MKAILRNFIGIVRRFKLAMFLNMAGLTLAFASFTVILSRVRYEQQFDRCHPTAARVFRLDLDRTGTFSTILPRAFIEEAIASSPHIEAGSLLNPFIGRRYFSVTTQGNKQGYKETVYTCHPDLVRVFSFPVISGDPDCLREPGNVLIPESMARKFYGNEPAVGKALRAEEPIWSKNRQEFTVGAVYRDFPENTQLRNGIYTAIDPDFALTDFQASNYIGYVLLTDAASASAVAAAFNRRFDFSLIGLPGGRVTLTPLTDIYYKNESHDGTLFRSGNREISLLLLGIALLIILVAAINYTNFSTALMPLRIRSINTRKVLGSSVPALRNGLLSEGVVLCLSAWVLSLAVVGGVEKLAGTVFTEAGPGLFNHPGIFLLSAVMALLTGLLAGLYPAWYTTSVPPALVLKGSFGLSASGRKLRMALIGVQFVVSILLIVTVGFIHLQNEYMRRFSLGFDKDRIAVVELSGSFYRQHREAYVSRLKEHPGIEDVAFSSEKVASKDGYSTDGATYKGKEFNYYLIVCSPNFLRVMGIPVPEGRDFLPADEQSETVSFIFNRTARVNLGMEAGDVFPLYSYNGYLRGFTGDVKFTSLRQHESNLAFITGRLERDLPVSYIRLAPGADRAGVVRHIRQVMAHIDASYPFDIEWYDTVFDRLYRNEERLHGLIWMFSVLAIVLSLAGVFGLVVFETQYRRKEIGIRKIHGATVGEILRMFNAVYLKLVTACFIVAVPLAWYGVTAWLEHFAYKVPLYWWVFALAFVAVAAVTLATVLFQNWKTATENPVNSIRAE